MISSLNRCSFELQDLIYVLIKSYFAQVKCPYEESDCESCYSGPLPDGIDKPSVGVYMVLGHPLSCMFGWIRNPSNVSVVYA